MTYADWTHEEQAEWERYYAIHNDGDRDEMMRMAMMEAKRLREALEYYVEALTDMGYDDGMVARKALAESSSPELRKVLGE